MTTLAIFHKIRPHVLELALNDLAQEENLRAPLQSQLDPFLDLLEECIQTDTYNIMDDLLQEWVYAQTRTAIESERDNVTEIYAKIMNIIYETGREFLPQSEFLLLMDHFMPVWAYTFEKNTQFEIKINLEHASEKFNQAQKAIELLERSKSAFISVAAHELRTPLTLIEGYTGMMQEMSKSDSSDPTTKMLINGIMKGTKRLHETINAMIDVTLIENNLLDLNYQPIWINHLIDLLKIEFEESLEARKHHLETTEFEGMNETIYADSDRMFQVLRNIMTNAVKFTPDGGKISISGRKLPGFLEVIISDTGIGISQEDQAIIFERFGGLGDVALHSSGKTKFKGGGAGLGLHIARGIIQAHDGSLWVESPGHDEEKCPGSTFHIMLPIKTSPPGKNR